MQKKEFCYKNVIIFQQNILHTEFVIWNVWRENDTYKIITNTFLKLNDLTKLIKASCNRHSKVSAYNTRSRSHVGLICTMPISKVFRKVNSPECPWTQHAHCLAFVSILYFTTVKIPTALLFICIVHHTQGQIQVHQECCWAFSNWHLLKHTFFSITNMRLQTCLILAIIQHSISVYLTLFT